MKPFVFGAVLFAALAAGGCGHALYFPAERLPQTQASGAAAVYRPSPASCELFFMYADASGRITRVGYGHDGRSPREVIDLDGIDCARCRHLLVILDGFSYDVVNQYYVDGGLRLFHPPSRVIAPYPTLTDLCLNDLLDLSASEGMEAQYYDRSRNEVVGGSWDYIRGKNGPYNSYLDYRANLLWDAIGYVRPWFVFCHEVDDAIDKYNKSETAEFRAYFVSSAGVGTRQGAQGQRQCLDVIDRMINQVVYESHGLVKVTLLADHGHSYTPATRIDLEKHLARRNWRIVESLKSPRDVAYIRFGLETYAAFSTNSPAELAADLVAADGVEVASYAQGESVVVLAPAQGGGEPQQATICHRAGRYRYDAIRGDPLSMQPVLAGLKPDADGYYGAQELLEATATHPWPAALERLWRAHFALVQNPPDVLVSLADRYFSGSKAFAGSVDVKSTHGSLNRSNSTTFVMSTAGPLPPLMRTADVHKHLKDLTGREFPSRR
jgi:hypothetical protein